MLDRIRKIINEFNVNREYKKYAPIINQNTRNLSPDDLVDFLFDDKWKRFFWMIQIPSEIKFLLNKVALIKPKIVVEIGTKMGGTLFLFTKIATADARVISIDFPDGHGGGYSDSRYNFYKLFAVPPQKVELIQADSHDENTRARLIKFLDGHKIDFLFIDGDHSYEGVKMDFEMYSPFVRTGGIVAFHDIKPTKENSWSGVIPFWDTIKNKYDSEEFMGPEDNWGGIGIVKM
jgi:predicted O-methyltransferase YrrM